MKNKYMNPPELQPWTEDDIRREFARIGNRRKVAKIYGIPIREVNRILKGEGYGLHVRGEITD